VSRLPSRAQNKSIKIPTKTLVLEDSHRNIAKKIGWPSASRRSQEGLAFGQQKNN
jgi:hypothetical protein